MAELVGSEKKIVDDFLRLCVSKPETWNVSWFGRTMMKNPLDMWIYQELICEKRPDLIIETGTYKGGSAYFFATIMHLLGYGGRIISIDVNKCDIKHPGIEFITGNSESAVIRDMIKTKIKVGDKVMVVLDSDHYSSHVSKEIKLYSDLVSVGQYMVVEDGFQGLQIQMQNKDEGPTLAIHEFLQHDARFKIDKTREKFIYTFFPDGWLLRIK